MSSSEELQAQYLLYLLSRIIKIILLGKWKYQQDYYFFLKEKIINPTSIYVFSQQHYFYNTTKLSNNYQASNTGTWTFFPRKSLGPLGPRGLLLHYRSKTYNPKVGHLLRSEALLTLTLQSIEVIPLQGYYFNARNIFSF